MRTLTIGLFIYCWGLVITIPASLRNLISSDQLLEYNLYLDAVQRGGWHVVDPNALNFANTSFITTVIPAYIQRLFNFSDISLIFRIFPCLLFAVVPVMTYLISQRYVTKVMAILASLFVLTHYYFMLDPFLGRVEAGWAFLSVFMYALLTKRLILSLVASLGLVFSHYGAAIIAAGLAMVVFIFASIKSGKKVDNSATISGINLLMLLSLGWLWFRMSGLSTTTIFDNWSDYSQAEYITRAVLGLEFNHFTNWIHYALWAMTWLVFLLMGFGIVSSWQKLSLELRVLVATLYLGVIVALVIPQVSNLYGIARVYFSGLPVLALFFVDGVWRLSRLTRITPYLLVTPFIIFHPNISPF